MNELFLDEGYTPTWCRKDEEENRKENPKMNERKEILQALRILATVCIENSHGEGGCKECPLRSSNFDNGCGIVESEPEGWDIVSEDTWRAFV